VTVDDDIGCVPFGQLLRSGAANLVTVADVYPNAVDPHVDLVGKRWISRWIGVAEYGSDRRDQSELVENVGTSDITSMENQLDPLQRVVHTWSHQSVRIGDETYQVNAGMWHTHFYILGVTCRGYDSRFD
jgi:hypothetical protein